MKEKHLQQLKLWTYSLSKLFPMWLRRADMAVFMKRDDKHCTLELSPADATDLFPWCKMGTFSCDFSLVLKMISSFSASCDRSVISFAGGDSVSKADDAYEEPFGITESTS
jgi:hypothetical protein